MRHAGNKVALKAVQPGLLVPVDKNKVHARQDDQHQKTAFEQDHPVEVVIGQHRVELLCEFVEPAAVFDVPIDPDRHQNDPGDLDADKDEYGMKQRP